MAVRLSPLVVMTVVGNHERKGVAFQSLQETIDTTSPGGKLVFYVFAALAEFERNLILERTQARSVDGQVEPEQFIAQQKVQEDTGGKTAGPGCPFW